mmetsp:Transcript_1640/g.2442  ORF Transcript_1640/g.2442 Transcript_1640/m.2442 type:complete len:81 (-) Transcript_1640:185-427(-)
MVAGEEEEGEEAADAKAENDDDGSAEFVAFKARGCWPCPSLFGCGDQIIGTKHRLTCIRVMERAIVMPNCVFLLLLLLGL